jgi:transposase
MIPNDLPPRYTVYQQTQRWLSAGVFEAMVRICCCPLAKGRNERLSAAILDSRTLQSSSESSERAGYDGAKRRKGSKTHMAVDTLGHLLCVVPKSDGTGWN